MACSERLSIIENLSMVDKCILFDDNDGSSTSAIKMVRDLYPQAHIIFANGGDRTSENILEMEYSDDNLSFAFGVGGTDKQNSSSWLLGEWKQPKTIRNWGYYRVLHDVNGCKVKELTVEPDSSISMQKHHERNEYWLVSEGRCIIQSMLDSGYMTPARTLATHDSCVVKKDEWHQLVNPFDQPCKIVEIQYGSNCIEEDIERKQ